VRSRPKHKILLLGSSPRDTDRLEIDAERAAIDRELRDSRSRDDFELCIAEQVEAGGLPGLIMRYEPRILHFSGHGNDRGELLFRRADGSSQPADKQTIAKVFGILRGSVRCVLLNACFSEAQASLIAEHVDVVIGMRRALDDHSAIAFSTGFYEALGFGKSFAVAFELGKARINLAELPDEEQPVLFSRAGLDPAAVGLAIHELPPTTSSSRATSIAVALGVVGIWSISLAVSPKREPTASNDTDAALELAMPEVSASENTDTTDQSATDESTDDDTTGEGTTKPHRTAKSGPPEDTSDGTPADEGEELDEAELRVRTWTVRRVESVVAGDDKRIVLEGPELPASGVLRLRIPVADDRRFASAVPCRIESGLPPWCMLVRKPGNDDLREGDELEMVSEEP
jgi:hypothetical protein